MKHPTSRPRGKHRTPTFRARFAAWWLAVTDEFAESVGVLPGDATEDAR